MHVMRGMMLAVGIALVCLAACANEWNPGPMLLMGGSGLLLCIVAKALPEKWPKRRKTHDTPRDNIRGISKI